MSLPALNPGTYSGTGARSKIATGLCRKNEMRREEYFGGIDKTHLGPSPEWMRRGDPNVSDAAPRGRADADNCTVCAE